MQAWITMAFEVKDMKEAEQLAEALSDVEHCNIIEVQPEPPQGSTIVGPINED